MLCQRLKFICRHNVVVLGSNPCPEETGAGRLLWASLAYMNKFKSSLGYRSRSHLKNKQKPPTQLPELAKKKKFKKSLDWTPELISDLQHRHPHSHAQSSDGFLLFTFASVALGLFASGSAHSAFVAGQDHSSECWADVYHYPFLRVPALLHLCKRDSSYPRAFLSAHPMRALVALWAATCHGSQRPKEVFDLLSCLTNQMSNLGS